MVEKCCYNKVLVNLLGGGGEKIKTIEDKKMVKLFSFLFKHALLGYILKNQHTHFLVHGHPFRSTFGLHLVRGPKAL